MRKSSPERTVSSSVALVLRVSNGTEANGSLVYFFVFILTGEKQKVRGVRVNGVMFYFCFHFFFSIEYRKGQFCHTPPV